MVVKVTQSCPTLCNPVDYTVHGILWAGILEWVPFPSSRRSSQPRCPTFQADSLPAEPPGKPIFTYFHLFLPLPTFITLSPRLKSMPPACLPEVYSILSKPYSDADGILIFFKNKIKSLVNQSHPCLKTPASFLLHKGKLPDSPS